MLILQDKVSFTYDRLGPCCRFCLHLCLIVVFLCCCRFSVNNVLYIPITRNCAVRAARSIQITPQTPSPKIVILGACKTPKQNLECFLRSYD